MREIFYGLFLTKIPNIVYKIIPYDFLDKIEVEPCGQEKIKYTIDHTNNDLDVVLKYEPSIYDALEEDDYYVMNGYDIEIILPKKVFRINI